jgi:hypothetical protein
MAPLDFWVLVGHRQQWLGPCPLGSLVPLGASGDTGPPRGLLPFGSQCEAPLPHHTSQGPGQQLASSWRTKRDMREKVLEQLLHWYFLVPEWVCRWARRLERSAKALLQ